MNSDEPFLFRFKKIVVSPSRATGREKTFYDHSKDMMMVLENGRWILAIDGQEERKTKKCDIEKGEDQKDGRLWH